MRKIREIAGYLLGGLMFVLLVPTLMWLASGRPDLLTVSLPRMIIALILAVACVVGVHRLYCYHVAPSPQRGKASPQGLWRGI